MSYTNPQDPERRASIDPNDPLPPQQSPSRRPPAVGGMVWGWVAGIAVLALILAFVFSGGSTNQSADRSVPGAATTGMAPTTTPPASPGTAQRPAPPATTGSGGSGQ
jgi:hypothetical protein